MRSQSRSFEGKDQILEHIKNYLQKSDFHSVLSVHPVRMNYQMQRPEQAIELQGCCIELVVDQEGRNYSGGSANGKVGKGRKFEKNQCSREIFLDNRCKKERVVKK